MLMRSWLILGSRARPIVSSRILSFISSPGISKVARASLECVSMIMRAERPVNETRVIISSDAARMRA